jgi:2-polyprenyl-6-methoxyphenol hydroxylase-like FAD-dependent oxidoreductase
VQTKFLASKKEVFGMGSDTVVYKPVASGKIARQAVVVGAGIGGLAAAAALADWVDHVILIEGDGPVDGRAPRPGTPQAWHCHGLLAGGQSALSELFPGVGQELLRAGAIEGRFNQDLREELADGTLMPQRDFGLRGCTMSRSLLESTLYRRIRQRGNITLRHHTQALGILADRDKQRVTSVRCVEKNPETKGEGTPETLAADIVVDATGRGQLTTALLESIRWAPLQQSTIGIDINYTTAIIPREDDFPGDWKVVMTHNRLPSSRRGLILPIEGNRWMVSVAGRGAERPPGDWPGVLQHLRQLATTTIYQTVSGSKPIGELVRFGLARSTWRHFERVEVWPDGLIPVGDAFCRFNPVYGQGMTVAAKQANLLHRLLAEAASRPESIRGLGAMYLDEAKRLIETPWMMAAIPDFAVAGTRGERPADLERSLRFTQALRRVAARDAEVQRLVVEVWHLLKPRSALDDPHLVQRVEAEMQEIGESGVSSAVSQAATAQSWS